MNLFGFLRRRRRAFDNVDATVLRIEPDGGAWAKPLPGRRSPYDRVAIPRRQMRRLDLKVGEAVTVAVDPVTHRTKSIRRMFGEPRRDAVR